MTSSGHQFLFKNCSAWACRRRSTLRCREYWMVQLPFHLSAVTDGHWSLIPSLFLLPLPGPSAFLGSRGGAGSASRPAARVAQEGQGATVVSAHSSGVGDRWPQGREEDLGPGARSARWETSRRALLVRFNAWHTLTTSFSLSTNTCTGLPFSPSSSYCNALACWLLRLHYEQTESLF